MSTIISGHCDFFIKSDIILLCKQQSKLRLLVSTKHITPISIIILEDYKRETIYIDQDMMCSSSTILIKFHVFL